MDSSQAHTIKGYDLLDRIGEGAYGAVYRARQHFIDREVAVKFILPQYANQPDFIRRFETEAQLVAQLEHLHIVPLYDYWRDPDGAYLVMRLMKGGSLADSLNGSGPWELTTAARLVDQIASALDAAHQKGIIHRDLKPANILLDEEGNAYLSDFGIAKAIGTDGGMTATGAIIGTPAYISPEQVQSLPISPQTDIYSLGVVLYELLTGEHPFPNTSSGTLIIKHAHEPLPLAKEKRQDLPKEVDEVIQKATSKDPRGRYSDPQTLAKEFSRALQLERMIIAVGEGELINPYKGLRAFQESDAEDFYGRQALINELIARLKQDVKYSRFLAVVGPSGSGKSSVVKAGLLPALRQGALPGSEQWFIIDMLPRTHPVEELDINLSRISVNPNVNVSQQLLRDERGLLRCARMILPKEDGELLIIVDQFEELFTLAEDKSEASHFMDLIYSSVTDAHSQVRVIITLRADFYDRPLMYPDFSNLLKDRTSLVIPLSTSELEDAIRGPAERVGAVLEKGLVPAVITDVVDQPGALPLLQYALMEMFELRDGRRLTTRAYQSIGGVPGALSRRAEAVFSDLDDDEKDTARQMFLRLVTLGEGAEDTRRRVLRSELESLPATSLSKVIKYFDRARLLSFDRDPNTRDSTVEVAHEALLKEWHRLKIWLDESRADLHMQRILASAAADWMSADQDSSFLLRGSRLAQFEDWIEVSTISLTTEEQIYLPACLEARQVREKVENERRQRELEQISIGLAGQALHEMDGPSHERAVPLALEALEDYPYTWQAHRALGEAERCTPKAVPS
jgi:serine/threonine protein kinase